MLRRSLPALLGVACTMPVVLLGAHTGWSIALSTLVLGATALVAAWLVRREGIAPTGVHLVLVGLTAYTALQLLPLPVGLVSILAPQSLPEVAATASIVGDALPSFGTITRSHSATLRELLKAAAILAAFAAAWITAGALGRRGPALAASGALLATALITIAHEVVNLDSVYGFYEFELEPSLVGPIGNQNHLAGMLAMGVPLLIGLGLDSQDRASRGWLLGAAALLGGTTLAAISRGGVLSLFVGLGAYGVLTLVDARRSRDGGAVRRASIALAAISLVGVGLALSAYVFSDQLAVDFGASSTAKLELAAEGLVLLGDAGWLGVGRGAFAVAYTELQTGGVDRMFYPENILVQWSTEWGVPLTVLAVGTLAAAWLRAALSASSPTQLGALASTLSVFAHDQVDFALENLAIAVCGAVILAVALTPSRARAQTDTPATPTRVALALAFGPGAVALGLSVAFGYAVHTRDRARLEATLLALAEENSYEELDARGREAIRMHPSEPVFPLILGWAAARRDGADAPTWLNRAMVLGPTWSSPHVITARWLARRGRLTQAWLEVREAEERRTGGASEEICLFVGLSADTTELARVFDTEPLRSRILSRAASCPGVSDEIASQIDQALVQGAAAPEAANAARVRLARRALRSGSPAEAEAILAAADPNDWHVRFARADAAIAAGRAADACAVLSGTAPPELEPDRLDSLARAHARAGDAEAMRAAIGELRAFGAGSGPRLARTAVLLGTLEESLGNSGRAYQAYGEAQRLDPASPGLRHTALLAERDGDVRRAYLAFGELCRHSGEGSPDCAAADRLRTTSVEHTAP